MRRNGNGEGCPEIGVIYVIDYGSLNRHPRCLLTAPLPPLSHSTPLVNSLLRVQSVTSPNAANDIDAMSSHVETRFNNIFAPSPAPLATSPSATTCFEGCFKQSNELIKYSLAEVKQQSDLYTLQAEQVTHGAGVWRRSGMEYSKEKGLQ